jgi:hypothetical protein
MQGSVSSLNTFPVSAPHIESSKANHIEARELRAYGSGGSYRALGTDVQAQAIFAGRRPLEDLEEWGYEEPATVGLAVHRAGVTLIEPGVVATELPDHIIHAETKQGVGQLYSQAEVTAEDGADIIAFTLSRPRRLASTRSSCAPSASSDTHP